MPNKKWGEEVTDGDLCWVTWPAGSLRPGDIFLNDENVPTLVLKWREFHIGDFPRGFRYWGRPLGAEDAEDGDEPAADAPREAQYYPFAEDTLCRLIASSTPAVLRLPQTAEELEQLNRRVLDDGWPDPTYWGIGGDWCPFCGSDWKQEHQETCAFQWTVSDDADSRAIRRGIVP